MLVPVPEKRCQKHTCHGNCNGPRRQPLTRALPARPRTQIIDFDWSNGKAIWTKTRPMDDEVVLQNQVKMSTSSSLGQTLGSRIRGRGQKMGSKDTRLAESERGGWFGLEGHSICTPHFLK